MTERSISRPRLSRAEADALSRQYEEGHLITERERVERFRGQIAEAVDQYEMKHGYGVLSQIRGFMKERGLQEFTTDIDPNILQQTICEELCTKELTGRGLTGPDLDNAYWECVHDCSPVTDPQTVDMDDPLYPHSSVDPSVFTTSLSLPTRKKGS